MSATAARALVVTLHCDNNEPACDETFEGLADMSAEITRAEAARDGWVHDAGTNKDFCGDHAE